MAAYYLSVLEHYEILNDHFKKMKGYEMYAGAADVLKQLDVQEVARSYVDVQTWGTPQMILEKLGQRRRLLGDFELSVIVHYGGLPAEEAERSMRLFGERVLPELHAW
jgi:hypothetical protein